MLTLPDYTPRARVAAIGQITRACVAKVTRGVTETGIAACIEDWAQDLLIVNQIATGSEAQLQAIAPSINALLERTHVE